MSDIHRKPYQLMYSNWFN